MPDQYGTTPNVPEPEVSARSMREATRAIPSPTQDQPGEMQYQQVVPKGSKFVNPNEAVD